MRSIVALVIVVAILLGCSPAPCDTHIPRCDDGVSVPLCPRVSDGGTEAPGVDSACSIVGRYADSYVSRDGVVTHFCAPAGSGPVACVDESARCAWLRPGYCGEP